MIELPRDLAPWRALLEIFQPELAESLGRLVPSLALAVGPMRVSRPTGDGEPDGFAGLGRRGSYERLLLTEWLLADELPDEFVRRAAGGEHAFFQLARRSPSQARHSVVLFDAGPDQLGAPRIAHLAALVVFAARAERARARFAWGVLHQVDRPLYTDVTQQAVMPLLAARSPLPAGADDVAAWAERARSAAWDDAWIVGAQSIVPGWRHATLEIRDVLDPARRALSAVARAPGAAPREIELELPPDRAAARLLRDPFSAAAPPPAPQKHGVAPISNLVFGANGTKVFARAESGEILAYPVPNSATAPPGRVKRYRPRAGGVVAAVGWVARGLVMLVIDERSLTIEHTARHAPLLLQRTISLSPGLAISRPEIADALAPLVYGTQGGGEFYFADAARALFHVGRGRLDDDVFVRRLADEVSAMAAVGHRLAFVGRGVAHDDVDDDLLVSTKDILEPPFRHVSRGWPDAAPHDVRLDGDGTFEACFGVVAGAHTRGLVAVQQHAEGWTVLEEGQPIADRTVPEDVTVIGPWRRSRVSPPELVVLSADRRSISITGGSGHPAFARPPAPIVDTVISTSRPQLAYVTTTGEVTVCSLEDGATLVRFLPAR